MILKRLDLPRSGVEDNYKKQLFPEHKLKKVGGLWNIKSCVGNKFIKEINPMNMENLSREDVVRQINVIIRENYEFMAYLEFARQIEKEIKKFSIKDGDDDKQIKIKIQAIRDKYSDRLIIIDGYLGHLPNTFALIDGKYY